MTKEKFVLSRRKLDILLILSLVAVVVIFLRRGALGEGIFFGADEIASDILHHSYVYREYFADDYLKHGKIPLWNPYVGSGTPVFGEAQTGVYFPIAAILYLLLPTPLAFNWVIIVTFILIALGTYLFARSLGLLPIGAFFASLVFTFSGFMVGHLRHVPLINVLTFMPYMFLVCEQIIKKPKPFWMVLLAFLIFLAFSPGQLATAYLLILMLIVYFLARVFVEYRSEKEENLRAIIIFFLSIFLGLVLSAAILLPALEMVKYSTRAAYPLVGALWPPYHLRYLVLFLFPYAFGDPSRGTWDFQAESYWENIGYIGVLPLLMVFLTIFWRGQAWRNYVKSFLLVLLFCTLLLFGNNLFFYHLVFKWIPGFSFTRIPGRFLVYIDFFLAILAGFGLVFVYKWASWNNRKLITLGLVLLTLYDLFYFGFNFNTVIGKSYFEPTQTVKYLKADTDLFRIESVGFETSWAEAWKNARGWRGDLTEYIAQRELIPPDYNLAFRIYSPAFIYGTSGRFALARPNELDKIVFNSLLQPENNHSATLFGMENVKYLISPVEFPSASDFVQVAKLPTELTDKFTYIYQNQKWLPRAYLVGKAIILSDEKDEQFIIASGNFDPQREVMLEKSIQKKQTESKGDVSISSYLDSNVEIRVDSEDGGYLVLSDTYYPGWRAFVDGRETEIYRANYAYRAIYVDGGKHKVIFDYSPESVKLGQAISIGTLVFLILIFVKDIWRNHKNI